MNIECEYHEGNWSGKGEEYNAKGEILFEGEYLNKNKWNGKIYDYDYEENKIYEGKFVNGLMSGNIIEYEIDNMDENKKNYLLKGSKQKNKRILLDENYEQSK